MPSRRHRLLPLTAAAASLTLLTLTACSTGAAAPGPDAAPVEGGTIVYAHQQEPACIFGGWIEQAYISYQVLDSLVSLDEDGEVVPWLAEEWEVSDDGLTWTFTLKEGVSFTDGTPVDAEAIAYNFDYWVNGGNSTAAVWLGGYYDRAEPVDDLTVAVHLSRPYPNFIQNLTQGYFGIQSQEALETRTDEENCAAPIGSGAFTVEEWNRGQNVILARNEEYTSWPANAQHTGPALVEKVDWRFVSDPTTRVAALQTGEVDAIYDVPGHLSGRASTMAGYDAREVRHRRSSAADLLQHRAGTVHGRGRAEGLRVQPRPRAPSSRRSGRASSRSRATAAVSQATPGVQPGGSRHGTTTTPTRRTALLDGAGWTEVNDDGHPREGRRGPRSAPPVRRGVDHQRRRRVDPAGRAGAGQGRRLQGRAHPRAAEPSCSAGSTRTPDAYDIVGRVLDGRQLPASSTSTGARARKRTRTTATAPSTTTPSSRR